MGNTRSSNAGFTLLEILVAMAIVALLLSLAVPRYFGSIDKAREATLRGNLSTIRDVLDKHYADLGEYPKNLDALVARRYLRKVPLDPYTASNRTWVLISPPNGEEGIYDVRSSSSERASDGTRVSEW